LEKHAAGLVRNRAAETDPPAVIEDLFAAPLATNAPVKLLPTLDVRAYRIEGDAALPPPEFGVLSNYTGKVDAARVRAGLEKLQGYYGGLGYSNLNVTLPEQKITNGLVLIRVTGRAADDRRGIHFGRSDNQSLHRARKKTDV
jgi:hemolysin activation/secretion protein